MHFSKRARLPGELALSDVLMVIELDDFLLEESVAIMS